MMDFLDFILGLLVLAVIVGAGVGLAIKVAQTFIN